MASLARGIRLRTETANPLMAVAVRLEKAVAVRLEKAVAVRLEKAEAERLTMAGWLLGLGWQVRRLWLEPRRLRAMRQQVAGHKMVE